MICGMIIFILVYRKSFTF